MIPSEPKRIEMPFAYEGARNDIPTEGGTETGNASMKLGFPPITQQPLAQGGIPPQRRDFNGILYMLSAYAYYAQSGGLYSYDESLDYAMNCIITHNNNIYICVANNGASTSAGVVKPGSEGSEDYWLELFVYLLRASGGDVGSAVNPIYIANGQLVPSTANVGGDAQPVRMNNGVIEALTATVGDDSTPVFLKAGVLTACALSGFGISDYLFADPGYVKFDCGFIVQWGSIPTGTGGDYTVTFPIAFTSSTSYSAMKNPGYRGSGKLQTYDCSFYSRTATSATTRVYKSWSSQWFAIGY